LHTGDEWGFIGSLSAPWSAPAAFTAAGAYIMDPGSGKKPAYLWSTPVSSRGYMDEGGDFYSTPSSTTATISLYSGSHRQFRRDRERHLERPAGGALAAVYVKDGKAGVLTSYTPGSSTGGITGGFYPGQTGEAGFWRSTVPP